MAEQTAELNQFAGVVPQIAEGEIVAQRMSRDRYALEPGAAGKASDNRLDRAHWHSRPPAAEEQHIRLTWSLTRIEILPERAPSGSVQRYIACFEPLAMPNTDAAGAVAYGQVGDLQRGDFADAQSGLEHQLDKRIVARGMTMAGRTGST
jgi:hypothetical protein